MTTVTVQLAVMGAITNSEVLQFDATASTKVTGTLSNNNRTLTITNTNNAANIDFQALLRTVKYANTDTATLDGNRTITFSAVETVNGQNFTSGDIVTTVSVALNDDAPVLAGMRSDAQNYVKSSGAAAFTEAGTAVVLESGLTVADSDHTNLNSVIVRVSEGYVKGEDKLSLVTDGGVGTTGHGFTAVFDADTGTLAISGNKTFG